MTAAAVVQRVGPTGVVVHPGEHTDRAGWLAARRGGIGASEIAAVVGLSPWSSPLDLFWRHLSGDEQADNPSTRWGRRLEAVVADEYAAEHPEFHLRRAPLLAHMDRPWQRASVDRLLYEAGGLDDDHHADPVAVLEVKTDGSYDGWGEAGTDDIPVYYRTQVLWSMDVVGLTAGIVAVLFNGRTYREYELTLDEAAQLDLDLLRTAGAEFHQRLQEAAADPDNVARWAPPIDGHVATTRRLKRLHDELDDTEIDVPQRLADQYLAACQAAREVDVLKAAATNQLLAAMGDARWAYVDRGDGARVKVATRSVSSPKRLDTRALRADHPDLCAAYVRQADQPEVKLIPPRLPRPRTVKEAVS